MRLSGQSSGSLSIWISGKPVAQVKEAGPFEVDVTASFGRSDLLVRSEYDDMAGPWHFNLNATVSGKPLSLELPQRVHGANGESWLYVGPFESEVEPDLADLTRTDRVYQTGKNRHIGA